MYILLRELLALPLNDTHHLTIPYAYDGFERLKSIIYRSRWQLRQYDADQIEHACHAVMALCDGYYQREAEKARSAIIAHMAEDALQAYFDVEQYVVDHVDSLRLSHLGEFDVLQALLFQDQMAMPHFSDFDGVMVDFSNQEFFAVLALFKSSTALASLRDHQQQTSSSPLEQDKMLPMLLARAINSSLEAQLAIHMMEKLDLFSQAAHSESMRDWQRLARQEMATQAAQAKYGDLYQQRRAMAIQY